MTRLFFKFINPVLLSVFLAIAITSCVPQVNTDGTIANSAYDPFPQTPVTPEAYTGSYPAYCGYVANSNRQECIGYSSTSSNTTTSTSTTNNNSSYTNTTTNTNTSYNTSYPSYCSQQQYSYRQDCGGNGIPPTTSAGYPSYCSDATYSYLVACGGNGSATTTNSAYPSYCSNSANSHLTACGGNGTVTNTSTTYTPSTPSYCSNPQHSFRVECGGNGVQNTVTSSSSIPAYCSTPANGNRPECNGTTTTGGNPTIYITPVNTNTNTANRPDYCNTPANSTRPECTGTTTTTNTGQTSAVNISGVWEGNLVNTENTLSVPTCMLLNDVNGQLTGQIYFRRSAALEYYGELQGSTQATASASSNGTFIKNSSLIVYYPDRSRTQFSGNFDSNNSFQSQYTYFDANGGTLTTGNSDLRKSNRSSCQ